MTSKNPQRVDQISGPETCSAIVGGRGKVHIHRTGGVERGKGGEGVMMGGGRWVRGGGSG